MTSAADIVAFDLGSATIKCGAVTEAAPTVCVPTLVGHRTVTAAKSRLLKKSAAAADPAADAGPAISVGDAAVAQLRQGVPMSAVWPIRRGAVTHWDEMEHIFNRCFDDLLRKPSELSAVVAVPTNASKPCTERIAQTLFESFELERFATVQQGMCALYASGRTTGIVLDVGHGSTSVTPVFDSYPIPVADMRQYFGGEDVSAHFKRLLYERGYSFTSPLDLVNLQDVKDGTAKVAADYGAALAEPEGAHEVNFGLPDGSSVTVGKERFRCAEILFDPTLIHEEHLGIGELIQKTVQLCSIDLRRPLMSSIVVTGGTSQMPGFGARVRHEVAARFPALFGAVHVIEPADRTSNVWSGAAVLANMPTFEPFFMSREVYEEEGPGAVHNYFNHAAAPAAGDDDDAPPPPPDD